MVRRNKKKPLKQKEFNLEYAWNNQINAEIAKLYQLRTNITLLLRNDGSMEEFIRPEIQILINKLQSLVIDEAKT